MKKPEKVLVGDVVDVEAQIAQIKALNKTLGASDRMESLVRQVAEERNTALRWENYFRSRLRRVMTNLEVAGHSFGVALSDVKDALDHEGGSPKGNYVNIPEEES